MVEVTAQTSEGAAITFEYEFGSNYAEAAELFGADIVWAYAYRALTIAAQGRARSLINAGKNADEIKAAMAEWKPGAPRVSRSPEDKIRDLMEKMSPEDRAAILQEIAAQAQPARKGKAA